MDAVDLCLPTAMHAPIAIEALRAGKHVLVEKPMALDAAQCDQMMGVLDAALGQKPWLSGDDFGISDIPMGVYAHTWFALGLERTPRPNVERWYKSLQQRPGYAANVMIPLV